MAKNTYKQDEVLEEPFDIRHLLRASSYIKKYAGRMVVAILLSGIGGAFGYVAPMIIQRALDLANPKPYHGGCQPEYHLRYPKRPV
jgi:ATP-binding cassette subfamily B protein